MSKIADLYNGDIDPELDILKREVRMINLIHNF